MLEVQVWCEAASQVFYALGLGFGGVIAFSSYNKRNNNCHFDAVLVTFINFFTSVLATLVVFAMLGFKANIMNAKCIERNAKKIAGHLNNEVSPNLIPHHINLSHVSTEDYQQMISILHGVMEDSYPQLGLESCDVTQELNKAVQGTGLAFIAFTEAMTHLPASPFWSVMFFLMLVNLGLGSMFGLMEGILSSLVDTFKVRKEYATVCFCLLAFSLGLIFVQRSGNYFVTMFDDYCAALPILVLVILEIFAVAWIYGTEKFFKDLQDMLGFTPLRYYYYMWKYVTPLLLLTLLTASIIKLGKNPPSYRAWIQELAQDQSLNYPPWGLAICIMLIIIAIFPVPLVFVLRCFNLIDEKVCGTAISYKKGRIIKESGHRTRQEGDDTSLLQGKTPSEAPSPMPPNRKQSSSTGQAEPASNGHLMVDMPL